MAFGIVTAIFTFVPEAFFEKYEWITKEVLAQSKWFAFLDAQDVNIIISRLVCFFLVWIGTSLLYMIFLKSRRWVTIKGQNYSIRVEYGNIQKKKRMTSSQHTFFSQIIV